MIEIPYAAMLAAITALWCLVRALTALRTRRFSLRRELQLLLVYVCIAVIVRFTFCPFGRVDGQIRPLLFDAGQMLPPRINLLPLVYLTDYEKPAEALLNIVGNTLMFVPVGIVFPAVFPALHTRLRALAAGVGFSLAIELAQLPFFDRVTDIDDLLLNALGCALGVLIFFALRKRRARRKAS